MAEEAAPTANDLVLVLREQLPLQAGVTFHVVTPFGQKLEVVLDENLLRDQVKDGNAVNRAHHSEEFLLVAPACATMSAESSSLASLSAA